MRRRSWRRWEAAARGLACGALGAASLAASACGPHVAALYPYPPFFRELPDGSREGMDKDLFDELARRSGCELRLVVESRVRIWDQMRTSGAVITLSAVPTPERRSFAEFVPYLQGRYHLMLRPDVAQRIKSLAAFEADDSLHLLAVKGYAHGPTLDAALQRLRGRGRVHEVADFSAVLRMAAAGRGHALLALPSSWPEVDAATAQAGPWRALDVAPQERTVAALALSLQMPAADRQRLKHSLLAMRADGTVQAIVRRHVGEAAARAAAYTEP